MKIELATDEIISINGYKLVDVDDGNGLRILSENVVENDKDQHYYSNGNNGLDIEESIRRAEEGVANLLDSLSLENAEGMILEGPIKNGVRHLIERNMGRDACYQLAGRVRKAYRTGLITGISIDVAFEVGAIYGEGCLNLGTS